MCNILLLSLRRLHLYLLHLRLAAFHSEIVHDVGKGFFIRHTIIEFICRCATWWRSSHFINSNWGLIIGIIMWLYDAVFQLQLHYRKLVAIFFPVGLTVLSEHMELNHNGRWCVRQFSADSCGASGCLLIARLIGEISWNLQAETSTLTDDYTNISFVDPSRLEISSISSSFSAGWFPFSVRNKNSGKNVEQVEESKKENIHQQHVKKQRVWAERRKT